VASLLAQVDAVQVGITEFKAISPPRPVLPLPLACSVAPGSRMTAVPPDRSIRPRCAADGALKVPQMSTVPESAVRVMSLAVMVCWD
jgi:hypothetical protein